MSYSVAVGSVFIECNHFGGAPADLETFRRTQLDYGNEFVRHDTGTVGGVLHVLRTRGAAIQPLVVASGCPSGPLTAECYDHLKNELLSRLADAAPVDGVLLALHGSAAAENAPDLEGDLLEAVRGVVGDNTPIVATLDLHAHVTREMMQAADALLAWETYPHRDARETGARGANMLLDILDGLLRPAMALAKAPVLVSGVNGHTEGPGPFADVMRLAKSYEEQEGVVSTSAFLVHPYLDLPDMGGGGLVITDGDMPKAQRLASEIAEMYWQKRFDLEPKLFTPGEAIARGLQIGAGPVILVETADCCGGGAAGDSVAALKALLEADVRQLSIAPLVDPAAAAACHRVGVGQDIDLSLGHQVDPQWGQPLRATGRVVRLSDGAFRYRGGIWDGQMGDMGPTALVRLGEAVFVVVSSQGTYEWQDEQFAELGLNARDAKFVVAKNPMNYSMAYGEFAKAAFILDTPGPTPATLKRTQYRNLRRPYYPADEEISGWTPVIHRSRKCDKNVNGG